MPLYTTPSPLYSEGLRTRIETGWICACACDPDNLVSLDHKWNRQKMKLCSD